MRHRQLESNATHFPSPLGCIFCRSSSAVRLVAMGWTKSQLHVNFERTGGHLARNWTTPALVTSTRRRPLSNHRQRQHALHDVQPGRTGNCHRPRRRHRKDNLGTQVRSPHAGMNYKDGFGPHSTPLLVGDLLYTVGSTGKFFALDKKTGKVAWSHDLWKEYGGTKMDRGYSCSPLAYKNTVISHSAVRDRR